LLQNAVNRELRWDPASGELPSAFFARVDPSHLGPTVNTTVPLPTFPNGSLAEPTALWATLPDEPVWWQINAIAAWQNTLYPLAPPLGVDEGTRRLGHNVFERAGCASCHGGPSLSNGRIVPAPEVGTQPARADALQSNERTWSDRALGYGFGQTAPFEGEPRLLEFPTDHLDPE
jgi:hypothetical protein